MRKSGRRGMIAVLVVSTVLAPAWATIVTVGRFYTELAQAKHLAPVDAASAEAGLRAVGFNLPNLVLSKSLTERDMISISNAVGIALTTQRPKALVSESQLNTFMASFGSQLRVSNSGAVNPYRTYSQDGDPGNSGNGKGKKKGHNKSTSDPS